MEIHPFEKIWFAASILLIVGFIGTVTYGSIGYGVKMIGDEGGTIKNPAKPTESPNFREPGVYRTGPGRYDVYVLANQFFFRPGTGQPIKVPAGSTVTLHLTSGDVIHGFNLVGTNVNVMAIPGQVGRMKIRFEEPGQYGLVCHEYCGVGHHMMEGKLVVVPPSEYTQSEETS